MDQPGPGPEQPAPASEPAPPGASSAAEGPGGPAPPKPPPAPEPPERESIIDAVIDLLQTATDWLRQEVEVTVRDKVAMPLQRVGIAVASTGAAGCLTVVGLSFIGVGGVWGLGNWIGFPAAFLLIGGAYLLGAVVFIVIRARVMLRETERTKEAREGEGELAKPGK